MFLHIDKQIKTSRIVKKGGNNEKNCSFIFYVFSRDF